MAHPRFLDHFQHPRGRGSLPAATHTSAASDPACGDEMELDLEVRGDLITAARFRVRGCSGAIAVASALATLLPGRPARADCLDAGELERELGEVPQAKRHVLRLALHALQAALQSSSTT